MDYGVRGCRSDDVPTLERIYRDAFIVVDGSEIDLTTELFRGRVGTGRVIVADADSWLVGFLGYEPLSSVPPSLIDHAGMLEIVNRELEYARNPDMRGPALEYLRRRRATIGKGDILLEAFQNEFTTVDFAALPNDLYCTETAVVAELRGNGVGARLISEWEPIAREQRASALYAHCWAGGNSPRTFLKSGFLPILKYGPEYDDGSPTILFGKRLR